MSTAKLPYQKQVKYVQRVFLDQVREAMDVQKINQSELARRTGCTRAFVSLLLGSNGDHSLNIRTAIRLADALGMNVRLDLIKGY